MDREACLYPRFIEQRIREALVDTPAVLILGPRRAGKTTLVRSVAADGRAYVTFDDRTTLDAARADPTGFIRGLDRAAVDEVQRVPEVMLAIKKSIDDDYQPGRFLLTGSANVLTLPRVADNLAGRMETIRVLPLARAEIIARRPSFLEGMFAGRLPAPGDLVLGDDLVRLVLAGGFPEAISRSSERRRQEWGRSWLDSVLGRDLRDIADIEKMADLPRFVRLLSQHAGQLVNYAQLGSGIGVTGKTSQRYVALLEQLFLVATLQPWYTNAVKRIVKTPKLHFLDSGILAIGRGLTFDRLKGERTAFGALLESFVFAEILKLSGWSELRLTPYHFRDQDLHEADFVLERDDGVIVGIEVKASATVTTGDFAGLRKLAAASGGKFAFGAVLYDGDVVVPFGERLAAVPISSLWSGATARRRGG